MAGLSAILDRNRYTPADVPELETKILITGPHQPPTIDDLGAEIASEVDWVPNMDLLFVPSREYLYPKGQSQ